MKILLTGGSGMVGKNILEYFEMFKHEFIAPRSDELNLLEYKCVHEFISKHQPDFIIHAAGKVGGIQANIENPLDFLIENLDMGKNLILAAKSNNVKNLLNLGSSCMYPKEAKNPLNEDLILKGELEPTNEGYALAKILVTRLCEYISKENIELKYKTIIPCNLFGKYDKFETHHSHMIPAVIKKTHEAKINKSKEIDIWGDGTARREFMYVGDLASFVMYAINNFPSMPQNLNVGLGHDYSINEYYQTIAEAIGFEGTFNHDLSKPIGMKQKVVDVTKLKNFGWESQTSLTQGIQKTYEFYTHNLINE